MRRKLSVLVLALLTAAGVSAQNLQNVAKGFSVDKAYQFNDADQINVFNGNLNVTLPIGPAFSVSSALSYRFHLTYGGNVWDFETTSEFVPVDPNTTEERFVEFATIDPKDHNAGLGWNVSLGRIDTEGTYISGDGAQHIFYPTLHDEAPISGVTYTRDSSYLRKMVVAGYTQIEFPDGTYHLFDATGRIRFMHDRFGNTVTINYVPGADGADDWEVSDGFRTHRVDMARISASVDQAASYTHDVVKQIILDTPASMQPPPTYTFTYAGTTGVVGISKQAAARQDCRKSAVALAPVLVSVTQPDGSKYEMTTDRGDAAQNADGSWSGTFSSPSATGSGATYQSCTGPVIVSGTASFSGHLTKLKYPTGGATEWTLQSYAFPPRFGDANCRDIATCRLSVSTRAAVGVKERIDSDRSANPTGRKLYAHDQSDGSATTTLTTQVRNANGDWVAAAEALHYYATPFRLPSSGDVKPEYGLPFTRDTGVVPPGETNPDAGGRYLSTKFFDGDGNLLRYTFVSYEGEGPRTPDEATDNRRMKSERVVHLDPSGSVVGDVVTTSDEFDGLGHYRTTATTTTTPPAALADLLPLTVRTVKTLYNARDPQTDPSATRNSGVYPGSFVIVPKATSWVLNTYSSQVTQETAGGATSTTKALFSFTPDTGFLTRRRVLKNLGTGSGTPALHANDLLAVFTENGGNVGSESYYGGDGQSLDVQQPLISMPVPASPVTQLTHTYDYGSLKTSQYGSLLTVNRVIDPYTGLTTSSFDPAGVETRFEYDWAGRLVWSLPVVASSPSGDTFGGVTQYVYTPPSSSVKASVTINQRDGARTGAILSTAAVDYDDFGRVWREKRTMPSNLVSTRETLYDDRGMVASVSEWGSLSKLTTYSYDALGRVISTKAPDDSIAQLSYTGLRTTTRTSNVATTTADDAGTPQTTTETTDDLGRLVQIVEPIGTVTKYGYDVGGHLASVAMIDGAVDQERAFHYDGRGLLQSETHPESGTTTYKYDARGHVTERAASTATVTFQYDAAERLVRVAEGTNTLEQFIFDRANDDATGDKSMGKLASAVRHNYGTPHGDLMVTETFRYRQPGGRLSAKETTLSHTGQTFTESYVYDNLGAVTTLSYPACASCSFTPTRDVNYNYTKGLLTGVPGYTTASGITYSSNGMVAAVRHLNADGSNGPLDTQTVDANTGMARPLTLTVTNFCDSFSAVLTPKTVTSGQSTNLTVATAGATTFKWFEQLAGGTSVVVAGQTGPTLDIIVNSTRQFWVRAGNGTCTVDSNVATVTVNNCTPPSAAITAPSTMNRNATAQASVPAASGPNVTYVWSVTGGDIVAGAGTPSITFQAYCSASAVQLSVVVTAGNCWDSGTRTVTTSPATTATLSITGSSTISWGAGKPITVALTGTGGWSGTWSEGGASWSGPAASFAQTVTPAGTTTYTVSVSDATGCTATSNPLTINVTPPTPVLTATAASSTQVQLNWSVPPGFVADVYDIERSTSGSAFTSVTSVTTTSWSGSAAANTASLYRVRAKKSGTPSAWSASDLATTVIFIDDPVVAYSTKMLAQHISQLRTAVNAVRALAGLPAAAFTDASVLGLQPKTAHVQELRDALTAARSALALPPVAFTDPTLVSGGYFKAVYINQLRGGVQ